MAGLNKQHNENHLNVSHFMEVSLHICILYFIYLSAKLSYHQSVKLSYFSLINGCVKVENLVQAFLV